jgi:hypothetical protein
MPARKKKIGRIKKGVCGECGKVLPGHSLNCPTLLSPKARRELNRRMVWRRRNAESAIWKRGNH